MKGVVEKIISFVGLCLYMQYSEKFFNAILTELTGLKKSSFDRNVLRLVSLYTCILKLFPKG